jgi:hypothetical protein
MVHSSFIHIIIETAHCFLESWDDVLYCRIGPTSLETQLDIQHSYTVLKIFCASSHFIFQVILWGGHFYNPHLQIRKSSLKKVCMQIVYSLSVFDCCDSIPLPGSKVCEWEKETVYMLPSNLVTSIDKISWFGKLYGI